MDPAVVAVDSQSQLTVGRPPSPPVDAAEQHPAPPPSPPMSAVKPVTDAAQQLRGNATERGQTGDTNQTGGAGRFRTWV